MLLFKEISWNLRTYRFKSIYARMIVVFCIILAGTIAIIGGLSYYKASASIQQKVNEANIQVLYQLQLVIDTSMEKVDSLTMNLAMNYMLQKKYDNFSLSEKLDLPQIVNSQIKEEYIDSVYIYYNEAHKIVASNYGMLDESIFPDVEWIKAYKEAAPLGFKPLYINGREIERLGAKTSVMTLIREFPLASLPKIGVIAINIDKLKLFNVINRFLSPEQSIFVMDGEGRRLDGDVQYFELLRQEKGFTETIKSSNSYKHIKMDGKNLMLSHVRSPRNGWIYVKVQNIEELTAEAKNIKYFTFWLALLSLLAGTIIWIMASVNFYNPLLKLLEKVIRSGDSSECSPGSTARNEIGLLESAVDDIIVRKVNAEELFKSSREEIKKGLLLEISGNENFDASRMGRQLEALDFPVGNRFFAVMIIKIEKYGKQFDEQEAAMAAEIKDAVRSVAESVNCKETDVLAGYIGIDRLMVLMGYEGNENVTIEAAGRMQQEISANTGVCVTIGIGSSCRHLQDVHNSYNEAQDALNYKVINGKGTVIHINNFDVSGKMPKYYYPISKELELVDAIKLGDKNRAVGITREIFNSIPKCAGFASYIPELLWQLMNGVFRSINSMGLAFEDVYSRNFFEVYKEYRQIENVDSMIAFIEGQVGRLIDYISEKRANRNDRIINGIKEYIEKNYYEEISLNTVASRVYMSPSYISTIFKEVTGKGFSDYILKIRMEKAMELLTGSDKSIAMVASGVGYEVHSFMRVFKKYTGMTPSEYRKDNMGKL